VQNKASIAANVTQHEIIQEAAERQRQEDKAAKQLERVQLQMAEWVRPLYMANSSVSHGWTHMVKVRRPREHEALKCIHNIQDRASVDLGV
jgi:hypothetical protein